MGYHVLPEIDVQVFPGLESYIPRCRYRDVSFSVHEIRVPARIDDVHTAFRIVHQEPDPAPRLDGLQVVVNASPQRGAPVEHRAHHERTVRIIILYRTLH